MKLFLIHFVTYWLCCCYFLIVDSMVFNTNNKPLFIKRPKDYYNYCCDSIYSSLKNQICITLPTTLLIEYYYIYSDTSNRLFKLIFYAIISDVYFYCTHRLCHTKYLYKYHKYHHRIYTTSVVTALDADLIEHTFINILTVLIGPMLWKCDETMLICWFFYTTLSVCLSHSGYTIGGKLHYNHHLKLNCNYGIGLYLMDRLMNTLDYK